jgi:hypothetical protein
MRNRFVLTLAARIRFYPFPHSLYLSFFYLFFQQQQGGGGGEDAEFNFFSFDSFSDIVCIFS